MDSTWKDQGTKFTSKMPKDQKTLSSIRLNISQSVASNSIRKGPNVAARSVALNDDFEIPRESGEGSIPLFEGGGVVVNSIDYTEGSAEVKSTNDRIRKDRSFSQSSCLQNVKTTESSEAPKGKREYVHRGCCGKLPIPKSSNKRTNENRATLETRTKVPYYRDEVREYDRLRRLYGDSRRRKSRSLSPPCSSKYRSRRRSGSTSRDRHRNNSPYKTSRSDSHNRHRSRRSHSRSHTPHRERPSQKQSPRHSRDSHSPCCSHHRHSNDDIVRHRTHSSSSQHAGSSRVGDNEHDTNNYESRIPPPTTYIPVPVPVPDYSFSFPHWHIPQNPWSQHIPHRAPAAPFGFPMVPLMPPIRPVHQIRYMVPPPSVSYVSMTSGSYLPRPAYRYPNYNKNVATAQNRYKHKDKNK